jgi:chemotaxis family two-component system sensor kinase Cph1
MPIARWQSFETDQGKEQAESYRQRIRLRGFEDDIVALLSQDGLLGETLARHLGKLRTMMDSDGVAVLRGSDLAVNGVVPGENQIRDLAVGCRRVRQS